MIAEDLKKWEKLFPVTFEKKTPVLLYFFVRLQCWFMVLVRLFQSTNYP